eukprot:3301886-Pyramimonas_sp.AAC.1
MDRSRTYQTTLLPSRGFNRPLNSLRMSSPSRGEGVRRTSLMVAGCPVTVTVTVKVQQMYLHEGGHRGPRVDDNLDGDNSNSNIIVQYSNSTVNVPA